MTDERYQRRWKKRRLEILLRDSYICFYCGSDATQVDHIIPIAKGGDAYDGDNLVACCKPCNLAKGKRSKPFFKPGTDTPPVFLSSVSPMQSKTHQDSPYKPENKPEGTN